MIFLKITIDGQRLLQVKLSIDNKVIAKARAPQKKAEEKHRNALILRFKKKWIKIMLNY
jgi:ribonuclease-3